MKASLPKVYNPSTSVQGTLLTSSQSTVFNKYLCTLTLWLSLNTTTLSIYLAHPTELIFSVAFSRVPSLTLPLRPLPYCLGPSLLSSGGQALLAIYEAYFSNEALSFSRAGLSLVLSLSHTQQHHLWEDDRADTKEESDRARGRQGELRRWGLMHAMTGLRATSLPSLTPHPCGPAHWCLWSRTGCPAAAQRCLLPLGPWPGPQ